MKTKYIYLSMMAAALSLGFTACSDDDDEPAYPTPNQVEKSEIAFDTDTVKVGVRETATFNITEGAGDYKVIAEDTAVATASISGNTVTVSSQKKGITGLVVSDAKGAYKRIMVKSMYFTMTLDKQEVKVGMKLGHTDGTANVKVLEGNGNYAAVSADESVAKISYIQGDSLIAILGVATGSTTITVTDMMGLTQTVNVTVETTSIAYTEEEKQELMNDNTLHWTWDGSTVDRSYSSSYKFTHETADDGRTVAYYAYSSTWWTSKYAQVWFDGDFSVGKKTNGRIFYDSSWSGYDFNDGVEVEIIKNDGTKAWGIFSVIEQNYKPRYSSDPPRPYLHYGNFVIEL